MQWNSGKNLGFSDADASQLYLPVDPFPDAPTVESEENDPASLYNVIKKLTALRANEDSLKAEPVLEVLYAEGPIFVYRRGDVLVGINTSGEDRQVVLSGGTPGNNAGQATLPSCALAEDAELLFLIGSYKIDKEHDILSLGGQSAAVLKVNRLRN